MQKNWFWLLMYLRGGLKVTIFEMNPDLETCLKNIFQPSLIVYSQQFLPYKP